MSGSVLAVGSQPISNRLEPVDADPGRTPRHPLEICVCRSCGLPQLAHHLDATEHFHDDYRYVSGASSTWLAHCESYADDLIASGRLKPGDLAVEAGSNDGSLLKALQKRGVRVLGVEPSGNVAQMAVDAGVPTKTAFFNMESARSIAGEYGPVRCVIGNNVLAHVPDTAAFLEAAKWLVGSDGFLCFEFPHWVEILRKRYFDTIYHEHYSYLGVAPLSFWATGNGMCVSDVAVQPVHGGSLRVFLTSAGADYPVEPDVADMMALERPYLGEGPWLELDGWLADWRQRFRLLLDGFHAQGKVVAGFAAASKATVFCNYVSIKAPDLRYCCDSSPLKQGRSIPGTGIPIRSPEELRRQPPDVVIVFAWNIFDEVRRVIASLATRPLLLVRALPEIELVQVEPRSK